MTASTNSTRLHPSVREELEGWARDLRAEGEDTETITRQIQLDYQARASRYATALGQDAQEPTEDDFREIAEAARLNRFITDVELENLPRPEQAIEGQWPVGGLVVPFGPPGAGKTFDTLDRALCIATGMRYHGRAVLGAPVVYVVAEGSGGMGARVRAWKQHRGWAGAAGVYFLTQPVNLLDAGDVGGFIGELLTLEPGPGLVVFDTLARCMIGGDENSALDMGRAIDAADRIRRGLGATVVAVHHTNKGGDLERGSTALRGAADTMYSLKDEDGLITLRCEKQKDAEPFSPLRLRLERVEDSCVLQPATDAWQGASDELTQSEREMLETLSRSFLEDGASLTQWMKAATVAERTAYRARTALVAKGYVRQVGEGRGSRHVVTDKGREVFPANLPDPATTLPADSSQPCLPNGGVLGETPRGRLETGRDGK